MNKTTEPSSATITGGWPVDEMRIEFRSLVRLSIITNIKRRNVEGVAEGLCQLQALGEEISTIHDIKIRMGKMIRNELPKGNLDAAFNLMARALRQINGSKSDVGESSVKGTQKNGNGLQLRTASAF